MLIEQMQVQIYYEACRDHGIATLKRELGRMWIKCEGLYDDGDDTLEKMTYYYCRTTGHSQWKLPFRLKTFYTADITLESFVHIMLTNKIFSTR